MKKIISLILALVVLLSCCTGFAFAAEDYIQKDTIFKTTEKDLYAALDEQKLDYSDGIAEAMTDAIKTLQSGKVDDPALKYYSSTAYTLVPTAVYYASTGDKNHPEYYDNIVDFAAGNFLSQTAFQATNFVSHLKGSFADYATDYLDSAAHIDEVIRSLDFTNIYKASGDFGRGAVYAATLGAYNAGNVLLFGVFAGVIVCAIVVMVPITAVAVPLLAIKDGPEVIKNISNKIDDMKNSVDELNEKDELIVDDNTAATKKHGYKVITALGDSASSGYGLADYAQYDSLVVYEKRIAGSYPDLLGKAYGAKVNAYGVSGIRSSELRFLLDNNYPGDDLLREGVMGTLSEGEITVEKLNALRSDYQNAVKEADLITLDLGFDDIWLPTIATIYDQADKSRFGDGFSIKDSVAKYGPELTVASNVGHYLASWLTQPINWVPFWLEWDKAVLMFLHDFYFNYDEIVKRIYQLNPDVTIVALGCYNPCAGWSLLYRGDNAIEHVLQPYFDYVNAEKAKFKDIYDNYHYVLERDVELINTKYTLPLYENLTLDDTGFNPHPTANGHRTIANLVLDELGDSNLAK